MNRLFCILMLSVLILGKGIAQSETGNRINFDDDWRFHLGGWQGAEIVSLNDSGWRRVDLPHDWSIEDIAGTRSPFNRSAISQVSQGFTTQGTAWYRKSFLIPANDRGKKLIIQFDGIYMNADVYLNGEFIGNHPYGYTSFYYDITKQLNFSGKNVLAVKISNEGENSRWYSGSGIYRHVWLKTVDSLHIAPWGVFITTPEINAGSADISINTQVVNDGGETGKVNIITRLFTAAGKEIGKAETGLTLPAKSKTDCHQKVNVPSPQLWSCESPVLYKSVTEIYRNGQLINSEPVSFGIRKITFDAAKGFQLNGKTVKLKGGCFHIDNGPLGSKAYDRAEERKVELLKASGFNAIRCSHNPPSPAFLDACDRAGILVIDEAFDMWNYGKTPNDYHLYFKEWWRRDIESMVLRDRNHPGIIMWSIGNEIPEKDAPLGAETARMLAAHVRELDTTRAVTVAMDRLGPDKDDFFSVLNVCGYNYAVGGYPEGFYARDHQRVPERIMFGSESFPLQAFGSWMAVEDHPYVIGDFVWTAWDYIGEAGIGWLGYPQNNNFYPWNLAFCGDIDICGWKRPQSYYRDALWKQNQLAIFVKPPQPSFKENVQKESWSKWNWLDVVGEWNWNGQEGKPMEVSVYSSCDQVELFLNNKSVGVKKTNRSTEFIADWSVIFQPGELKAIGYTNGKPVQTAVLKTASPPEKIKLTADRSILKANGQDLSYIVVELTDARGITNPQADNLIKFSLTGDGEIGGIGNADPESLESFQLPERKAWKGKCLVIVKADKTPGKLKLTAQSEGLSPSEIVLDVQ